MEEKKTVNAYENVKYILVTLRGNISKTENEIAFIKSTFNANFIQDTKARRDVYFLFDKSVIKRECILPKVS